MAIFVSIVMLALPASFDLAGSGYNAPWWLYYNEPWRSLWERAYHLLSPLGLMGLFGLFFLFPDGRIVPHSLRWPAAIAFGLLLIVGGLLEVWSEDLWIVFFALFLLSLLIAAASQLYRFRRVSSVVERQQTKMVIFCIAFMGVVWPLFFLVSELFFRPAHESYFALASLHLQVITLVLIPLSITLSILRYRLWDIDLLINRTLVYGSLTLLVITLYALVVGGISALLHMQAGLMGAALLTGVVALLAHPLRTALQRVVNRLMYGERDDPITALTRLGERLESTRVPDAIYGTITETITQTLKTPYVAIASAAGGGDAPEEVVAEVGTLEGEVLVWPLVHQGQRVGELRVAPRAPGEPFSSSDERLLTNLARQAGAAVHAAQLTEGLQRSRERLVVAREEERRRLQRDLHDGLGPQLASLTLKLDAAYNLLDSNPEETRQLLEEGKAQAQQAIADVRQLVYQLYPLVLEQMGLSAALRSIVVSHNDTEAPQVTIDVPDDMPALPAAVAAAAYYISREAITNAVRHARARHCHLHLALDGEALTLEVADDGSGLEGQTHGGVGLTSMRERAEELGGTFSVESPVGGGTVVRARLPL